MEKSMWEYNIDYEKLFETITNKRYESYNIQLIENYKYKWNIQVRRVDCFDTFPWNFEIQINNDNNRKQGFCEFEINCKNICIIINIDSEFNGLGSIMFNITNQILTYIEIKFNIQISEIYGELAYRHKINDDWIKSIPFYSIMAYNLKYKIEFYAEGNTYRQDTLKMAHDDVYMYSLDFAKKFSQEYKQGSFSIIRNHK